MKHFTLTAALLAFFCSVALADTGKDDLKKLLQAGLSDDLILSYARSKGPVARLSADDVVELKTSGMSDALLEKVLALAEPAKSPVDAARAKLLSDPSVVYDGRYYYPRSYFSSDHTAYCSPAIGIGISYYYPGWVSYTCSSVRWPVGRYYSGRDCWGAGGGYGSCGYTARRVCHR
jgi:hypothetical protein